MSRTPDNQTSTPQQKAIYVKNLCTKRMYPDNIKIKAKLFKFSGSFAEVIIELFSSFNMTKMHRDLNSIQKHNCCVK